MGTSITTEMPEPQTGAEGDGFTLSQFLSILVSGGSCFCCGSPTDLMLDGSGVIFVRCPTCGAELSAEETACARRASPFFKQPSVYAPRTEANR